MLRKNALLVRAVIASSLLGTVAFAQQGESSGDVNELKKEIAELRQEIGALRTDLSGLRAELSKAVATMRTPQPQPTPAPRQRPAESMVGQAAPEFGVTTIDDQKITIGGKREKPQVAFFWASWCGFCKKSMPWIESLHQKYKDKGVEIVAVNLDARGEGGRARSEEQTLEVFKGLNVTLPMTMTTASNDTSKIGVAYKAQSFPTLFVLGANGQVESVHIGAKQGLDEMVGKELDMLLEGKTHKDFPG